MVARVTTLFLLLLCLRLVALGTIASAQPTEVLPPVVVTGYAESLTSPDLNSVAERFHDTPGAVSVYSSEHYQLGRGSYLEDFLPYTPGVLIQSSQGSEDTKVSVRGSGAQEDDIIGLGVLLDGMPLNQGDGEAFLHDLDLRSVKYAEVYRGADALRYGSVTLGGAINLVTMTGRDAPRLQTWLTAGSYGLLETGILSGLSKGPFDAFLTASSHFLDGFRDHSQEDSQKVFFSLGYRISQWAENRFYLFWGHLSQNNPSSLTQEEMLSNPRQTDPESIAQNWGTQWDYFRVADRFLLKGDDCQFQLSAYYSHRDELQRREFDTDNPLGTVHFYSDDFGGNLAFESTADVFGRRNRLTIGLNLALEGETDTNYANLDGNIGPLIAADTTFATNLALYFENQHYLTKCFSILAGFQAVYVQRNYRDRLNSPVDGNQSNNEDFRGFNPKLGLLYAWSDRCKTYVNVSGSFQPPSFDQSLQTAPEGNQLFKRLDAQTAITIEAGTAGKAGPFSWDVAIYHSWVRNELLDLTNGQGFPLGTINAPKTYHQGIEAGLQTELGHALLAGSVGKQDEDRLVLEQTYTLSDFHFRHDSVYGNNRIAGTPVHFYKAELRYEHPSGFYGGPNVEWNIVRYPVDEANTLFSGSYALFGFRFGYKSKKGFEAFFEAKNLTDKIYAATVEPVGNAQIEGARSFNPGNGRSMYGGVSWTW